MREENGEAFRKSEDIILGLKVKDMMKKRRRRKRFGDRQVNRSTMPRGWDPTSSPVAHLTCITGRICGPAWALCGSAGGSFIADDLRYGFVSGRICRSTQKDIGRLGLRPFLAN